MSGDDDEESIEEEGKTKLHLFNPESMSKRALNPNLQVTSKGRPFQLPKPFST